MRRRSKRLNKSIPDLNSVLPDEIIRMILLRVPYESHFNLKLVCKQWRDVVSTPEFYKDRMTSGTSEHLICMIQYLWEKRAPTTSRIIVFEPVKRTWATLRPNPDFLAGIPGHCMCVCVNRKLLLIGGKIQETNEILKTVYIYDFVSAKWRRGADMPTLRSAFGCSVSSSTGLIYVAGGRDNQNALVAAQRLTMNSESNDPTYRRL